MVEQKKIRRVDITGEEQGKSYTRIEVWITVIKKDH